MDKCYGCAHFDPKLFYCFKYLRDAKAAVNLCNYCRKEEMQDVINAEAAYAEALND